MLVLKRRENSWLTITHAASGDVLRVRVYHIRALPGAASAELAFDDAACRFAIERSERAPAVAEPLDSYTVVPDGGPIAGRVRALRAGRAAP